MAKIARANFQKCVDVLGVLQSYWHGLRYIRIALVQKGQGAYSLTLTEDDSLSPLVSPDRVSEWLARASTERNSKGGFLCHPSFDFWFLVLIFGSAFGPDPVLGFWVLILFFRFWLLF